MKVLPELLKSVEFGGGGPKVFGYVMKIGAKLPDYEYDQKLTPVLVRLFANPDRQIRVCLLDNLPQMIEHFPQKLVSDKIFPQVVCTGLKQCDSLLNVSRSPGSPMPFRWFESRPSNQCSRL